MRKRRVKWHKFTACNGIGLTAKRGAAYSGLRMTKSQLAAPRRMKISTECAFTIKGQIDCPLLMHAPTTVDPLNPYSVKMRKVSTKRQKTEDDYEAISRIEFLAGLYFEDGTGPYIPSRVISACLIDGAKKFRLGRAARAGITPKSPRFFFKKWRGPKTAEALFESRLKDGTQRYVDKRCVRVTTSRIMRTRPRFDAWEIDVSLIIDATAFDPERIEDIVHAAGTLVGICDNRPECGRFELDGDIVLTENTLKMA